MILELTAVGIALGYLVWKAAAQQGKNNQQQSASPEEAPAVPSPRLAPELKIDGTAPFKGKADFLRQFNINPAWVADLRYVAGPGTIASMPETVRHCLSTIFSRGGTRGLEVPALLYHGRELQPDEALYFALVAPGGVPPYVVGLVDRLRSADGGRQDS